MPLVDFGAGSRTIEDRAQKAASGACLHINQRILLIIKDTISEINKARARANVSRAPPGAACLLAT